MPCPLLADLGLTVEATRAREKPAAISSKAPAVAVPVRRWGKESCNTFFAIDAHHHVVH